MIFIMNYLFKFMYNNIIFYNMCRIMCNKLITIISNNDVQNVSIERHNNKKGVHYFISLV